MAGTLAPRGKCFNYLRGNGRRTTHQDLAHAKAPQPARPRARGRRLRAPSELRGDRTQQAQRADGPAPRRAPRGPAQRTQPDAAGRGLRAGLRAAAARRARARPGQAGARPAAQGARAVPGRRDRPREHPHRRQQRGADAARRRRAAPARTARQRPQARAAPRGHGAADREPGRVAGPPPARSRRRARPDRATRSCTPSTTSSARYPGPEAEPGATHDVFVPLKIDGLTFLSTRTTFGTAMDVTVSELAIEAFYPADEATFTACSARR